MSPLYFVSTTLLLILCGALTFRRINALVSSDPVGAGGAAGGRPGPRKRGGQAIAASGACLTLSYFLLTPPLYEIVDQAMPAPNATDLVSKYFALVAVAFLGGHLSAAYGSGFARRWTAGGPGVVVLGVTATALLGCFVVTDAPQPSPQLAAYSNQLSVRVYIWLVLAYVAYIVFPLLKPAYKESRTYPLRIGRIASGLIAGGFALSFIRAFTYPLELSGNELTYLYMLVSYVSTAAVVIGLALFAYSRRKAKPQTELGRSILLIDEKV